MSLAPFGVRGRVDASALASARVELEPRAAPARSFDNQSLRFFVSDGQKVDTSCSAPVAWQSDATGLRVTQEIAGIEVWGTAIAEQDARCPARVWRDDGGAVPDGYRSLDPGGRAPLLDRPAVLYWIADSGGHGDADLACSEWQYRPPSAPSADGELRSRSVEPGADGPTTWAISFVVHADGPSMPGTGLELLGPHAVGRDARGNVIAEATGLCAGRFVIAGRDQDGVIVLPNVEVSRRAVIAYHPDDARTWYLSRSACQRQIDRLRSTGEPRVIALARFGSPGC